MTVLFRLLVILVISVSCDSDLEIDADLNNVGTKTLEKDSKLSEYVSINPEDICTDVTFINRAGETQKGKRDCAIDIADKNCTFSGENNCFIGKDDSFIANDDLKPSYLKSGLVIGNITGTLVESPKECTKNFETDCLANSTFQSIDATNLVSKNIKFGISIAGYTGTVVVSPADCTSNGEQNCVTTATYKAADLTNLLAGNIKNGISIAGQAGNYPSATSPLTGNTAAADLTAATMNAKLVSATAFEFIDSEGNLQSSTGDADLIAGNIKSGISILGLAGSLTGSPVNCTSNTEVGCITTPTYKAADLTNLSAGNIKNGISIAGQAGDYPSATSPLAGNTAAADLTAATMNAKLVSATTFEFFDSAGNLQSSAGDADLVAGNIESGNTIFGVAGSVTASPADCTSNGEQSCVTTATYKAADLTNLTAGNIKNGISIAGQAGDYPSATNPLTGNTATADLTTATMNSKLTSPVAFEFFDSAGNLQSSAGDADLIAGNIESGNTIFGVAGSVTASPSDCSSNTEVGCVSTATYKAADLTNLTAGNIKNGVSIAGQAGDYPSATYPLSGATGTDDLTLFTTQLVTDGSFEYWSSAGVRNTGSGDSDIIAANVKTGVSFENFSVTGSYAGDLEFYQIDSGLYHSCGLTSSGAAYCWGRDNYGQLGDGGSNTDQPTPVAVSGGYQFTSLSLGQYHSCGLTSSGAAYCWGRDDTSQLGDGGSNTEQPTPVAVSGGH